MSTALERHIDRIKTWMRANGAAVLVDNLADGCSEADLAKAQAALDAPIPEELATLWRMHNGQKEELNGFCYSYDLLSIDEALDARDDFLHAVHAEIEDADGDFELSEINQDEANDLWLPFARRDSDMFAIHLKTGRIVDFCEELSSSAESLSEFFARYADGMESGSLSVVEGFGDCYIG